ncbi:MAG: hypothetical protein O7G85_12055 [Planctomycetota bacterium]|nr:hypothetical protein [Planctomycetota bacterium]
MDIEIAGHKGLKVESQAIVQRVLEDLPENLIRDHPLVDHSKRTVSVVYRVVDGKSVFTPVKAGPSDLTHTIVVKGIDEGDWIMIGPYKALEDIEHDKDIRDPNVTPDPDLETELAAGNEESVVPSASEASTSNLATSGN